MWVMKRGTIKYFREMAAMSLKELQRGAKVAISTIARLQSKEGATVRGDTLHRLAKALGRDPRELADWKADAVAPPESDHQIAPAPLGSVEMDLPQLVPVVRSARASKRVVVVGDGDQTKLPPSLGTLSKAAAWERGRGVASVSIETKHGPIPLLGFEQFKAAFSAPKVFDGQRFVVYGIPDDYSGSHASAAEALDSDAGVAMRFRIVRVVRSDGGACPIRFYSTVYTGAPEHGALLRQAVQAKDVVALLTRLVYRRRAFALFEAPAGRPRDLAFLVESILPASSVTTANLAQPKARRNIRQKSPELVVIFPEKMANKS